MTRSSIFASLLAIAVAGPAAANVGPPYVGGRIAGEPIAVIKNIAIARETLTLDFRPLALGGNVLVEAIYHLDNTGPEQTLDLVFATGSNVANEFKVWLGDKSIASVAAPNFEKMPESWKTPSQTPGIRDAQTLKFITRSYVPIAFTLAVPAGKQVLKVRYEAETGRNHEHHSTEATVYRQFAYILAPARAWADFGGLDVTVHLPEGWRAAVTPALARDGDTLKGSFASLPADAIALTVQAPVPESYATWQKAAFPGFIGVCVVGLVLCLWVGWRKGRSLGKEGSGWLTTMGLGMLWGAIIFGAGMLAIECPEMLLPTGQVNHYGYGKAFAMIGVILLASVAVPLGFLFVLLAMNRGRNSK